MTTDIYTDIEALVIRWLDRHKIEYSFSTSIAGGFYELGGAVVDFLLHSRGLAWRVHGVYWHTGVDIEGHDQIQRELLEGMGWTVVDIWSDDILDPARLEQAMRLALIGQEVLRG